ncbi:MAG: hypothetical protein IKQ97_09645 [Eubacterium sp.]|nr:hypothetical protein [Eubacterium sp.]
MNDTNNTGNPNDQEGFMDKAEGFFDKASDFITENGEKFGGKVRDYAQEHDLDAKAGNAIEVVGRNLKSVFGMIKDSFNK